MGSKKFGYLTRTAQQLATGSKKARPFEGASSLTFTLSLELTKAGCVSF